MNTKTQFKYRFLFLISVHEVAKSETGLGMGRFIGNWYAVVYSDVVVIKPLECVGITSIISTPTYISALSTSSIAGHSWMFCLPSIVSRYTARCSLTFQVWEPVNIDCHIQLKNLPPSVYSIYVSSIIVHVTSIVFSFIHLPASSPLLSKALNLDPYQM